MQSVRLWQALLALPCFMLCSCNQHNSTGSDFDVVPETNTEQKPLATAKRAEKPDPPLKLAEPGKVPETLDGKNLQQLNVSELLKQFDDAIKKEDYARALAHQYWYVQKTKLGQYNLACCYARLGKNDAAFYWLQIAAMEEGVDSRHARRDEDLAALTDDPRWDQVYKYFDICSDYIKANPDSYTLLLVPKNYVKGTPIPVVLWLHGFGANPDGFLNSNSQKYADQLNVAIVGVSGSQGRGKKAFAWDGNPEIDSRRIKDALKEIADRVTIKPGHLIAFGFSQGAQVGLAAAVREPEQYAGAIVLSPGSFPMLKGIPSPTLSKRGFVLSCGAEEHPFIVTTQHDAKWLIDAKAQVHFKAYPGASDHSFPNDFSTRFPEWVKFILSARSD